MSNVRGVRLNKFYVVACFSVIWLACGDATPARHEAADESADGSTPVDAQTPDASESSSSRPADESDAAAGAKDREAKPEEPRDAGPSAAAAGSGGSTAA